MKKKHLHNEQLGYHTPEGYFEQSKKDMLGFLETQKPASKSKPVFKPFFIGVGLVAVLVFGVFALNDNTNEFDSFEQLTIESLDLEEEEFDQWFDENFILNDV